MLFQVIRASYPSFAYVSASGPLLNATTTRKRAFRSTSLDIRSGDQMDCEHATASANVNLFDDHDRLTFRPCYRMAHTLVSTFQHKLQADAFSSLPRPYVSDDNSGSPDRSHNPARRPPP
ncbi:hypothetical protein GALMADRAFT_133904 [Galerina marginata CBS 339.88]|uniref:Uncharacterized protein n=1 Tax=Galerina marginata (strain CBS 339.88) TaxID=685588 RepID=A0A067TNA6_GALM3|nr:hypothetical protein GALMADRAFT_133904 [Galerina marginata CBS 339.88]